MKVNVLYDTNFHQPRFNLKLPYVACILFMISFCSLIFYSTQSATAQNWAALPPYNTLWPLWSPALSPVNEITGLPTPMVTNLTPSTVLPVQPGLTWHPSLGHPWLLYNSPLGMLYYDPWIGIDLWPPRILMNQITGLPINIALPLGYADLPPTPAWWILSSVPAANGDLQVAYPNYSIGLPIPPLTSLLGGPGLL